MDEIKLNLAKDISSAIDSLVDKEEILNKIEIPKDIQNGDLSYPCFNLAKTLKKSPVIIANEIKDKLSVATNKYIDKISVVNGYLNIYINSDYLVSKTLSNIVTKKEEYATSKIGDGKVVLVDYSSPNIAKPFHLGHLMTTVIGSAICNLNRNLGYSVVGINHLGDWGRQFGLLIEGYNRFKDEYDIEKDPLHTLSEIYTKCKDAWQRYEQYINYTI